MPDIDVGAFSEALNDKMDRDANNIESPKLPIFLVAVQHPTAENNYTWYRKYSDGWVEQGQYDATQGLVSFPVIMADTSYTVSVSLNGSGSNPGFHITSRTVSNMDIGNGSGWHMDWQIKGMAA